MLRIRADKWQEFCERVEELGFFKVEGNYYFSDFNHYEETGAINIGIDEELRGVYYYNAREMTEHKLYDLIAQGFVEKVED